MREKRDWTAGAARRLQTERERERATLRGRRITPEANRARQGNSSGIFLLAQQLFIPDVNTFGYPNIPA